MNWFRMVGLWMAGLAWMVAEMGCAYAADGEEKPSEAKTVVGCANKADSDTKPKYTGPMILTEEIDPVENPLSDEPGAIEIPLDQISTFPGMPGSPRIGGEILENSLAEFRRDWEPMLTEIYETLLQWVPQGENLPPGFAVVGTNLDLKAVQQMYAVLVEKQPSRQSFLADSEITLVFFSYKPAPSVQLHRVDRVGNQVEIRYRFVPSHTGSNIHFRIAPGFFALIHLGKLEAGEYRVNVVKSGLIRTFYSPDYVPKNPVQDRIIQATNNIVYKPISREEARKMVCNSFSFTVEEK